MASQTSAKTLKMSEVRERCLDKGYRPGDVDEAIDEYEQLNVFSINQTRTKLTFIDTA